MVSSRVLRRRGTGEEARPLLTFKHETSYNARRQGGSPPRLKVRATRRRVLVGEAAIEVAVSPPTASHALARRQLGFLLSSRYDAA